MSDQFVFYEDNKDEFKMWQGLKGPYYTPYVDEDGNLSWTNNGGLPNPATVNIKGVPGTGLEIKGIVETVSALPATAASGDVYLVGTEPPYDGYLYADGGWTYIGVVGVGENGRGIVSITKTSTVGLVDTYTIEYTDGVNPTTFTVTNGANGQDGDPGVGVPTGGTAGQILAKASGTDYDTNWVNQSAGVDPATATPLMDGTGAVGSSAKYAREDHVHPSDTAKQDALVSGTNIKTVNGQSLLGSGNIAAIPTGGAAGKALVKASSTDYDVTWGDAVSSVNGATGAVVLGAEDVGATPEWTLMWTNASPTSDFPNQTVPLTGIGNFNEYAVVFKSFPSASLENTVYFLKPNGLFMLFGFVVNPIRRPECSITTDSFTFGTGAIQNTLGTWSSGNQYFIPIRIYGR